MCPLFFEGWFRLVQSRKTLKMSTYFNLLNVKSRSKNVGTAPTPVPLAATARLIKKNRVRAKRSHEDLHIPLPCRGSAAKRLTRCGITPVRCSFAAIVTHLE